MEVTVGNRKGDLVAHAASQTKGSGEPDPIIVTSALLDSVTDC